MQTARGGREEEEAGRIFRSSCIYLAIEIELVGIFFSS